VPRAKKVLISGLDETGTGVSWEADGWSARIVQHEMDHLEGLTLEKQNTFWRYNDNLLLCRYSSYRQNGF